MAEVQRANVFLTIPDEDIDKYLAKGYNVVDERGRIIKQSVPTELGELQKAYSEHEAQLKQKDAEIASLKSEIQALKTAGVKKTPAAPKEKPVEAKEDWDDWADAEEVEEKPTKKRKSKE